MLAQLRLRAKISLGDCEIFDEIMSILCDIGYHTTLTVERVTRFGLTVF
jgi:hypothetical protein